MLEEPGEHLLGQYLKEVLKCDFVEYNLQTEHVQGELDVVWINSAERVVYLCESATHLETGLQYTKNKRPDNVNRFIAKFEKSFKYAELNFKDFNKNFILWTPIGKTPGEKAKYNQMRDIEEIQKYFNDKYNIQIKIICNSEYLECINELRRVAFFTTRAMKSPIMRFLQIEEKLKLIQQNK